MAVNIYRQGFPDSESLNGQGDLRVSQKYTQFAGKFEFGLDHHRWRIKEVLGATVTYSTNESAALLNVSNTIGSKAIMQSSWYIQYQPSHSSNNPMTFVANSPVTGIRQRIGIFDDNNGLFLEINGLDVRFVIRSSTSGSPKDTPISQVDWNKQSFIKTHDIYKIDFSRGLLLIIDYLWQGFGEARFGFSLGGKPYYGHEARNANVRNTVFMSTGTLPLRYEIENTGYSGTATMKAVCAASTSEGGSKLYGFQFVRDRAITALTSGYLPLIAIRPALLINGKKNRGIVIPTSAAIILTGSSDLGQIQLIHNPTIVGGSWDAQGGTNPESIIEYNISATSYSGGHIHDTDYITSSQGGKPGSSFLPTIQTDINLSINIDGDAADTFLLVAKYITGTPSIYATLKWDEIY